ncbi:MAG: hypothetical protein ACXABY_13855 [Candidatus Thorarchaeota archaeon]
MSIEVWCSCGYGLCSGVSTDKRGIHVEPCPDCLSDAKDEGFKEGYDAGDDAGYSRGHDAGYEEATG